MDNNSIPSALLGGEALRTLEERFGLTPESLTSTSIISKIQIKYQDNIHNLYSVNIQEGLVLTVDASIKKENENKTIVELLNNNGIDFNVGTIKNVLKDIFPEIESFEEKDGTESLKLPNEALIGNTSSKILSVGEDYILGTIEDPHFESRGEISKTFEPLDAGKMEYVNERLVEEDNKN